MTQQYEYRSESEILGDLAETVASFGSGPRELESPYYDPFMKRYGMDPGDPVAQALIKDAKDRIAELREKGFGG